LADVEEHILVVPASVIDHIGAFEGFQPNVDRYLTPILACSELSFQPRSKMETDPSYKQLIPYVVLQWIDDDGSVNLFTYTRGGGGGEKRLHAKRSIGIGGHISREDATAGGDVYTTAMQRELEEEVQLNAAYQASREGLIYDPSNEVGQVHLGVVHRFVLESPAVSSNEQDLANGGFVSVAELYDQFQQLETWSQLTLRALFPTSDEHPT